MFQSNWDRLTPSLKVSQKWKAHMYESYTLMNARLWQLASVNSTSVTKILAPRCNSRKITCSPKNDLFDTHKYKVLGNMSFNAWKSNDLVWSRPRDRASRLSSLGPYLLLRYLIGTWGGALLRAHSHSVSHPPDGEAVEVPKGPFQPGTLSPGLHASITPSVALLSWLPPWRSVLPP